MNDEQDWKDAFEKFQEELDKRRKTEPPQFPRCCPTCGRPKDGGAHPLPYGPWWPGQITYMGGYR